MRWVGVVFLLVASVAHANGRFPANTTIHFRQGSTQDVLAGVTFGTLISHDGGGTWHWMCEQAIGYGGQYDPDFAYTASGAIFATTFNGLHVNRDGCTYAATSFGTEFFSQVEVSSAALHACAADPTEAKIFRSTDDGISFPVSAAPGANGDWWSSMMTAPSDAQRAYLAGYRQTATRTFLLFTSNDGGTSYTPMTTTGMTTATNSTITIVGVAPSTPTTLYAKVELEDNTSIDGIYKSVDTGATWTRIFGGQSPLAFVARANGQLVVAGQTLAKVSTDGGMNWTDLVSPPHINCLEENSLGELWACTRNYGTEGYAIMKTTDLATWTGVLRYEAIAGPVDCAAGTTQHDTCVQLWCGLRQQLSIVPDPTGCNSVDGPSDAAVDAPPPPPDDAPIDAPTPNKPSKGCCDTGEGSGGPGTLVLALLVIAFCTVSRRRRR